MYSLFNQPRLSLTEWDRRTRESLERSRHRRLHRESIRRTNVWWVACFVNVVLAAFVVLKLVGLV